MSGHDGHGAVDTLKCATYTHARRYPLVLGRIGGWAPPFQLSIAQIVVLAVTFGVLWWTAGAWAHAPGGLNMAVQAGVPIGCAWAVRHVRLEGREPLRTLAGMAAYLASSRRGTTGGHPAPSGGGSWGRGARAWVRRSV